MTASFYNNLFAIEIAVFGIIAASLFVMVQIAYGQFSHREARVITSYWVLRTYVGTSVLGILGSGASSLFLSFPSLGSLGVRGGTLADLVQDWRVGSILLGLFIVSLGLFAAFAITSFGYLRPSRVALLIGRRASWEQVRDYMLRRYGVPFPALPLQIRFIVAGEGKMVAANQDDQELRDSKAAVEEKQFELDKREYERIRKQVENVKDPFEPLNALMLKAISGFDMGTINEVQDVLVNVSVRIAERCRKRNYGKMWDPDSQVAHNYLLYLSEIMRGHLGLCQKQGLTASKLEILETSERIAAQFMEGDGGGRGPPLGVLETGCR